MRISDQRGSSVGIMIFIELEREVPNLQDGLGGKALAHAQIELDEIAAGLGLPTIMDLTSDSPESYAELMESCPDVDLGSYQEQWFKPADGLQLVQGLAAHLRERPSALEDAALLPLVVEDLEEAANVLRAAAAAGAGFHFTWAY